MPSTGGDASGGPPPGGLSGIFHTAARAPLLTGLRATASNYRMRGPTADQIVAPTIQKPGTSPLALRVQTWDYYGQLGTTDGDHASTLSYRANSSSGAVEPARPMTDPLLMWRTMFSSERFAGTTMDPEALKSLEKHRSVVNGVKAYADMLKKKLGQNDQRLIDEHLAQLASLQKRVNEIPMAGVTCSRPGQPPSLPVSQGYCPTSGCVKDYSGNNAWSSETERGKAPGIRFCESRVIRSPLRQHAVATRGE